MVQMWCQDWSPPYPALWPPAPVPYPWQHPQVFCINNNTFLYNACVSLVEFTSNPTTLHMPYSSTPQLLMHSSNAPTKVKRTIIFI